MRKQSMVTVVTMILALALGTGCQNKRDIPEPKPDPEEKPNPGPNQEEEWSKIKIEAYLLNTEGQLTQLQQEGEDSGNYEYGTISGAGTYKEGEAVMIRAEIKDFMKHTLVSLYEKDGKGGFTKEKGKVERTIEEDQRVMKKEQMAELHLKAAEDMTFIAIFEDYKTPSLEIENIYGHEYWVQKNREAMNYIKPRIRTYKNREEVIEATGFTHMYPFVDLTLIKRTVYQYSTAMFELPGGPRYLPYRVTDGDFEKTYRFTYALTSLDENEIVEIFPPSYSVSGGNFPQLNYITVPEGSYRVRLLVNLPSDREVWHLIPMMPTFTMADEHYGKDYGWCWEDPLPKNQNWYRDGDIIYVKNRVNNQITTPVWDDQDIKLMGQIGESSDVDLTVTITNITNQRMEGSVIITDGYSRWWHEEGRALMDMRMQKVWIKEKEEKHPYESWEIDRGEQNVWLLPNEKVTIKFQIRDRSYARRHFSDSGWGSSYRHLSLDPGVHTIFYWKGEDEKRQFMTKGNSKELAIMQERDWGNISSKHLAWWYEAEYGFNKNDCVFSLLCPTIEERERGIRNVSFCRNAIVFDD